MPGKETYLRERGFFLKAPFIQCAFLFIIASMLLFYCGAARAAQNDEEMVNANPHLNSGKKNCSLCHAGEPPKLNFDPITTCTKCHPNNVGNHPVTRHPLGKTPRIHLPAFLPTSNAGQIVCYTCHDQHNRSGHPNMLRVEYLKLCASCHIGY